MKKIAVCFLALVFTFGFKAQDDVRIEDINLPTNSNYTVQKLENGNIQIALYYENNVLKEVSTLDLLGRLNGSFKKWDPKGQLVASWNFKKNKLHGKQQCWNADGTMKYQRVYQNGQETLEAN